MTNIYLKFLYNSNIWMLVKLIFDKIVRSDILKLETIKVIEN